MTEHFHTVIKAYFLMPTIMHRPLPLEKQYLFFITHRACTGSISCMFDLLPIIQACTEIIWQEPSKLSPWLFFLWRIWRNLPTTFLLIQDWTNQFQRFINLKFVKVIIKIESSETINQVQITPYLSYYRKLIKEKCQNMVLIL